ncbi:hypothetical protein PUNSTDRAFT_128800 [Punctularia strigosozonata HHB-11173 SS5]|uniref:uncharacterized protein n=1 Tax=Punctularia strigosozonata (strain HHB-11173) TaxID=741275 RepID=UPI0004417960|nr:uncharacterized protein PUNSTDRAFT_128800 [Punctularia strigosozonata HHB-11173 SS5]EIN13117.1 hypothetical protein PUNSTDRAFT_128800 [Punctularia strigosozonata HHB-11173 SS5]
MIFVLRMPSPNPTGNETGQRQAHVNHIVPAPAQAEADRTARARNDFRLQYALGIIALAVQIITSATNADGRNSPVLAVATVLSICALVAGIAATSILLISDHGRVVVTNLLNIVGMVCVPMSLLFLVSASSSTAVIIVVGAIFGLGFLFTSLIMWLHSF